MNVLLEKLTSSVRLQDLVVVVVCLLSVYLLRSRDTFVLEPSWRRQVDAGVYRNGRYPTEEEWLPRPVVTDLDGDGDVEIVHVDGGECELLVSRVPDRNRSELTLPDLEILRSFKMTTAVGKTCRPVALETGYLVPPKSESVARTQVIVVVLHDWTVLCFDHELSLLWKRETLMDLGHQMAEQYVVKAMSIIVTSHSLQKGDNGSVIFGGRRGHKDHNTRFKSLHSDVFDNNSSLTETHDRSPDDAAYTHFSTFALAGSDGSVRWHHLPGDFEQIVSKSVDKSRLHWKLNLKSGKWHVGEVTWEKYSGNIIKHMPHSWRDIRDTRFDVADLRRASVINTKNADSANAFDDFAPLRDVIGLDGEHHVGLQYGGMTPHSRHEHVKHPTAVIVHNDKGIEVLNVENGRPLTHLNLESRGRPSVFVDVNEDDTIEELTANFALKCQGEVSTIRPRPKALFAGPLCESPFWWGGVSLSNLFYTPDVVSEDTHVAVTPVAVPSIAKRRGIFNHLLGHGLPSERKGYDSVFLTSTGRLTSYSPSGNPNWQASVSASWSSMAFRAETESNFASTTSGDIYLNSFQPSLKPVALQIYAQQTAVVVSGWDSMVLVDLKEGHVLGQHSLPCQTIDSPIMADFNRDGWTDFVISCPDAYIGFELRKASNLLYSCITAFSIIVSILLLVWCFRYGLEE